MDIFTRRFRWVLIRRSSQDMPNWEPIMETVQTYPDGESRKYFDVAGSDKGLQPNKILKLGEYLEQQPEGCLMHDTNEGCREKPDSCKL